MPGHGDHWECVYDSVDSFVGGRMQVLVERADVADVMDWPEIALEDQMCDRLIVLTNKWNLLAINTVLLASKETGSNLLATSYPLPLGGIRHSLTIREVEPWDIGIEGVVTGETSFGAQVSFFDPFFYRTKDDYVLNGEQVVRMSAFAYPTLDGPLPPFVVREGELYDMEVAEGRIRAGEPLELDASNTKMLFPIESWGPSEFSFAGRIKSAKTCTIDDRPFYALRTAVMVDQDGVAGDDQDFDIMLFCGRHALAEGLDLKPEASISGRLWMHGTLDD